MKRKKSCKGKSNQARRPVGRPVVYSTSFDQQARVFIESGGDVKGLAKLFGVDLSTVYNWVRDYPKFAEAIRLGREALDAGEIHRSMIQRAKGYVQVKTTKELRVLGPECPPKDSTVEELIEFAADELGMTIPKHQSKSSIYRRVKQECKKKQKEVMVVVKVEETPQLGDVTAAKYVLPNIGPDDEPKWQDKVVLGGQVGITGLGDVLKAIDGKTKGLPAGSETEG